MVEMRSRSIACGQDKGAKRRNIRVEPVDLLLKLNGLALGEPQWRVFRVLHDRGAQIRPDIKQVVLDACQYHVQFVVHMQPRETNHCVGLIHRAVGFHTQVMLGDAAAVAKTGIALVSGFCIDLGEPDHSCLP